VARNLLSAIRDCCGVARIPSSTTDILRTSVWQLHSDLISSIWAEHMKKIKSILVANRSEIAIRVLRAASEMGIRTVAIFSNYGSNWEFESRSFPLTSKEVWAVSTESVACLERSNSPRRSTDQKLVGNGITRRRLNFLAGQPGPL
jgi:hypothetical protein